MVFAYALYLGLIGGSLLAVLFGLARVGEGFQRWRQATALHDVPIASLDAVSIGEAAIVGRLEGSERDCTVPVADQQCVCYDLDVIDSTDTLPVHEERDAATLFVTTDDGRLRIDPAGFEFDLTDDRTGSLSFKSYDDPPDEAVAFAEEHDLPDQGMRRDREFRYEFLRDGDEVYAYGTVEPDPEREAGADEKAVVLVAGDDGFLSNKSTATLLRERRFTLARSVVVGVVVGTVGLAAFLWLTGIAQLFL